MKCDELEKIKEAIEEYKKKYHLVSDVDEGNKEVDGDVEEGLSLDEVFEILQEFKEECIDQVEELIGDYSPSALSFIEILFSQIYACEKLENRFLDYYNGEEYK